MGLIGRRAVNGPAIVGTCIANLWPLQPRLGRSAHTQVRNILAISPSSQSAQIRAFLSAQTQATTAVENLVRVYHSVISGRGRLRFPYTCSYTYSYSYSTAPPLCVLETSSPGTETGPVCLIWQRKSWLAPLSITRTMTSTCTSTKKKRAITIEKGAGDRPR